MSSLTTSINLLFDLPRFLSPGSSILSILLPIYPSSFLRTLPYHLSLASRVFSPTRPTYAVPLMYSFLILSILVTPNDNRSIMNSATSGHRASHGAIWWTSHAVVDRRVRLSEHNKTISEAGSWVPNCLLRYRWQQRWPTIGRTREFMKINVVYWQGLHFPTTTSWEMLPWWHVATFNDIRWYLNRKHSNCCESDVCLCRSILVQISRRRTRCWTCIGQVRIGFDEYLTSRSTEWNSYIKISVTTTIWLCYKGCALCSRFCSIRSISAGGTTYQWSRCIVEPWQRCSCCL